MQVSRRNSGACDGGFTIVEVLIAMLLLAAVIGGATIAIVGGNRLQGAAKARAAMTDASERVYEQVRADRSWMNLPQCQRVGEPCNLTDRFTAVLSDASGPLHLTFDPRPANTIGAVVLTPVDSAADGVGRSDQDSTVPDFYQVAVTIALPATPDAVARFGAMQPIVLSSTIDASKVADTGSLIVNVCAATNQSDERMAIASCDVSQSGDLLPEMKGCPAQVDCSAYKAVGNAMSGSVPTRRVALRAVRGVNFVLKSGGRQYGLDRARNVAGGGVQFDDLPVGPYTISLVSVPTGFEHWESHDVPAGLGASVERRRSSRALIALRVTQGTGTYRIDLQRTIRQYDYRVVTTPPQKHSWVKDRPTCNVVACTGAYVNVLDEVWQDQLVPGGVQQRVVPGAFKASTFTLEPAPKGRFVSPCATGSCVQSFPNRPAVAWGTRSTTISGLPTGLFSRLTASTGAGVPTPPLAPYEWVGPGGAGGAYTFTDSQGECYQQVVGYQSLYPQLFTNEPRACTELYWKGQWLCGFPTATYVLHRYWRRTVSGYIDLSVRTVATPGTPASAVFGIQHLKFSSKPQTGSTPVPTPELLTGSCPRSQATTVVPQTIHSVSGGTVEVDTQAYS